MRWDAPTGRVRISLPGLLDLFLFCLEIADYFDVIIIGLAQFGSKSYCCGKNLSGDGSQLLPWCRGPQFQRVIRVFGGKHHINDLTQKLSARAGGIKSAGHLRGF